MSGMYDSDHDQDVRLENHEVRLGALEVRMATVEETSRNLVTVSAQQTESIKWLRWLVMGLFAAIVLKTAADLILR